MNPELLYKKEIEQAKANFADFLARGDECNGGNWDDFEKELFTESEIEDSKKRVALMIEHSEILDKLDVENAKLRA